MSNIFLTNDAMYEMARDAADDSYLESLAAMGVFADVEAAIAAFDAASKARHDAEMAKVADEAMTTMKALLEGFTMPKSLINKLTAIAEVALEAEMGYSIVSFSMREDAETGEIVIKPRVVDLRSKPSKVASGGKGKAMLDGKPLTSKLLRDEYPDSFARKALDDPHAADSSRWGPKTRLNATQAVKADSVLVTRLTFAS